MDEKLTDTTVYAHLKTGRSRAALRGIFWSAINSLVPAFMTAGVFMVTSRVLTPAEFGIVAFAASIAALASAVAPAGFADALLQRSHIDARHIDSVFWLCVLSAIAIYIAILAALIPLADVFGKAEVTPFLAIIGLRVIFDLACAVPNALLSRSMQFNRVAMRTTMASLAAATICLIVLAMGFGAWALALSQLASSVTAFAATMFSVSWRPRLRFDFGALAELRRFGLFASGTRFVSLLSPDQILIGSLLGASQLGLYGFAKRILDILNALVTGTLNSVSYSLLSSLQSEKEKARDAFLLVTFLSAAVAVPIFGGLAAVAQDIVPLFFGSQWIAAVSLLQGFCAIGLLSSVGILQSSLINSQGKAGWWTGYMLGKQLGIGLIVLLASRLGVHWLVLLIVTFTYLYWPVAVAATSRLLEMSVPQYLGSFVAPLLAGAAMCVAMIVSGLLLSGHGTIVQLAVKLGVGSVTYPLVLFAISHRRLLALASRLRNMRGAP